MSQGEEGSASSVLRAVTLYVALAYAITWLGVSPLVAKGLGLYGGTVPEWWHGVGALGPISAAFLTAWITGGRPAVWGWAAGLRRHDIGAGWWVVAVGSPWALLVVAAVVVRIVTGAWSADGLGGGALVRPSWWLGIAVVSAAYGLGEEPGWRGYLLPELMRRFSARSSTFLLAVIWSAWHVPFFTYRYDFAGPATVVGFFIAMLAGAAWLTFLYLSTDGSVLAVASWHAMWNVVNFVAAEMSDLAVGVLNAAIIIVGFGVLLAAGSGLRWRGQVGQRERAREA